MSDFAFDAVLFDLDGTLVATERYWPDAARAATLRFFGENAIEREIPSTADWMGMVGLPIEDAFADTFADLEPEVRADLLDACMAEEHALLARGHAAMLGGVEETLTELKRRGVRLGIASNCGYDYLDVMMNRVGLNRWVEEGRCLASPGVSNKADMITDLLATFDTRSAVMVGDRPGDRDAAWANAVPHVHIPRGYGGARDRISAQAVLDGMDQLIPTLEGRDAMLADVLERLGDARVVAVTGLPLAGKTLVARDLERLARARGTSARVVGPSEVGGADAALVLVDASATEHAGHAELYDARVRVDAEHAALVDRAAGRRLGPAPIEALEEVLPTERAALEDDAEPTVALDVTNPIVPVLR